MTHRFGHVSNTWCLTLYPTARKANIFKIYLLLVFLEREKGKEEGERGKRDKEKEA